MQGHTRTERTSLHSLPMRSAAPMHTTQKMSDSVNLERNNGPKNRWAMNATVNGLGKSNDKSSANYESKLTIQKPTPQARTSQAHVRQTEM